ncbi:hypothetical protein NPIL_348721, partial [Nephila pilipes]
MSKDLVQCCFLYDFKVGLSEAASSRRIFQVFGDGAVNERTTRHLLKNLGREICLSVMNLEVDDRTPWMTKPA